MNFNPIDSAQKLFGRKTSPDDIAMVKRDSEDSTLIISGEKTSAAASRIPFPDLVHQKYLIRRLIGKGAFGSVFLAEDRKIGRLVAIKQLEKKFSEKRGREIYDRFMLEARIGAQLDHPNIINVFGLEEDRKSACIIMEYLPGGSLASKIRGDGGVSLKGTLRISSGILSGLQAAHEIMVTHRDIKPQNIIFDAKDEPKISDFGIALLPFSLDKDAESDLSRRNILLGTPLYMAPEQLLLGDVDPRADLYSLGAVIYEMLSGGRRVFDILPEMTIEEVKKVVLRSSPAPLDASRVPAALSDFVMKLLDKHPSRRYQSAASAKAALADISESIVPRIEHEPARGAASSPAAMLEDVIRLFLIDGNMSPAERRELQRRGERLGLGQSQMRILEEKVRAEMGLPSLQSLDEYREAIENALERNKDFVLNSDQIIAIENMRRSAGIKEDDAEEIMKEAMDKIEYRRRLDGARFKI